MTHQAAMHASKMKNLTRRAQKMLGFLDLTQEAKCRHLAPFRATLDIATADWDVLFHAIEERLDATVADKPGAPFPLLTDETAARNRVVVLECISAMEQLHTALTHERQSRQ